MLGKTEGEFEEKLLDGRALLFSRNGIFQVRLYKGTRQYIYKSLKTRDLAKVGRIVDKLAMQNAPNPPKRDKTLRLVK